MPSTPLNRCAIAGGLSGRALTRLEIVDSGAGRPVLRIEVSSTSSKTGVSHEYGYRQPAASAHDRRHERAQALCRHAEGSYPRLQAVRGVSQAVPRNGYGRGYPPVSVAPGRGQLEHLYPQPDHDRAAVPVAHNAAATGSCRRDLSPPRAPEGSAGDEPGRDKAPAGRRSETSRSACCSVSVMAAACVLVKWSG